jgi:PEGA domain
VVRCSGDGACLADLGYRLGVNEVVLVAVSEFGDAVITLQRIGVDSRKVEARLAEAIDRGKTLDDEVLDRYLTRLLPPSVFLQFGVIDVVANQSGATVRLSGEARGQTPITPLRVRAPASYDLRVEKPGFVPFTATVAVPPQGAVKVTAQLTRRAPKSAWYQRRWVIAVAAATVVSAAGTAAYFATRPDRELSLGGVIR